MLENRYRIVSYSRRCGGRTTATRRTICGCSSLIFERRSKPTRQNPNSSSPNPGSAIASPDPMRTRGDASIVTLHILRLLASIAGVAIITYLAVGVIPVNATTVGFAFLLYVLVVASTWGFAEAAISSIAATLTFNYF